MEVFGHGRTSKPTRKWSTSRRAYRNHYRSINYPWIASGGWTQGPDTIGDTLYSLFIFFDFFFFYGRHCSVVPVLVFHVRHTFVCIKTMNFSTDSLLSLLLSLVRSQFRILYAAEFLTRMRACLLARNHLAEEYVTLKKRHDENFIWSLSLFHVLPFLSFFFPSSSLS